MSFLLNPYNFSTGDSDVNAYIAAVELADGQALESTTKSAIQTFILGCKSDGIWNAIKASCILAGARTLTGAITPLVKQVADASPTTLGTSVGWNYNRKTGLKGNGTDNAINTGRNNNADPQNSKHISIYIVEQTTLFNNSRYISAGNSLQADSFIVTSGLVSQPYLFGLNNSGTTSLSNTNNVGFVGISRNSSTNRDTRVAGVNLASTATSGTPRNQLIYVFANQGETVRFSNARMSFYSIGESLNLTSLDTRLIQLMTDINAAF